MNEFAVVLVKAILPQMQKKKKKHDFFFSAVLLAPYYSFLTYEIILIAAECAIISCN